MNWLLLAASIFRADELDCAGHKGSNNLRKFRYYHIPEDTFFFGRGFLFHGTHEILFAAQLHVTCGSERWTQIRSFVAFRRTFKQNVYFIPIRHGDDKRVARPKARRVKHEV
jgi:hypothetical protein